jgi:ABC-type glycerol-3-phosphate transport system substrate-binding protein
MVNRTDCLTVLVRSFSGITRSYAQKRGVNPSKIKYWEDMLDAVKKCKAAGVTPIAVGGSEKWPSSSILRF